MSTQAGAVMNTPGGGFSAVYGPDGRLLSTFIPSTEEGIVYADLDMDEIYKSRAFVDLCGHYSRPDLLWLGVDNSVKAHVRESKQALVPVPSRSPLDPLNWSRTKKELLFATIIFGSCATGSLGSVLVPGFAVISAELDVDLSSVTLLNGSLVMALGVSAYLCACCASVYGKRVLYLVTTIVLVVSCCWAAASPSYARSLHPASFKVSLSMGGFFALAGTASINEVFFVHERGLRVGLWNFGVIASVNLTPVISGYIISKLSWRWSFWLEGILFGVLLAAVILCFPETSALEKDYIQAALDSVQKESRPSSPARWLATFVLGDASTRAPAQHNILAACINPLRMLLHPVVIWECIMWAVVFTWTILLGAVASQIFTAPPYNMTTVAIGNLTGIAPFIGSALGTIVGGWLCDALGRVFSSRNGGVYEPEFRLLVMPLATITMAAGSFGLGEAIENGAEPVVCGVFMAILNFAIGVGCTGIVAYTNDVCGQAAGDAFGLAMVVKSAFAFGLSFVFNDFLARSGPLVFFSTFGALTVGVMLTTIPLYVYGKRIRAWAEQSRYIGRS
ncbi:major facilitator superfamily domain-containing protein [Aspergillus karnatakaensis]|uniref:major facilitator superfamily domain-containing protein n=1 Tax=Aspergillus karnatakaensis TaxID=1810916 RepID=UPI003CCCABDB